MGLFDEALPGRKATAVRCGARTRHKTEEYPEGRPCRRLPVCYWDKTVKNKRCLNHGGMSTGPRTTAGRRRSHANLIQNQNAVNSL